MQVHKTVDKFFHDFVFSENDLPFSVYFLDILNMIDFGFRNQILHGVVVNVLILFVEQFILG